MTHLATRPDHHLALELIRAPYLETGFMDHKSYAPLNEKAYRLSDIVLGNEQLSGQAQGFVKVHNGVVEGAEPLYERTSNAIAGKPRPPTLYQESPNGFTADAPAYSHDLALPLYKRTQMTVLSSWYTGLLRTFVQAVEGHPSRRYGLTQDTDMPRLTIDGIRLEHTGQGSHWVWCCMPEAPEGSDTLNTQHAPSDPSDSEGDVGWFWENTVTKAWFGPKKDGKWGVKYGLARTYWLVNVVGGLVRFQLIKTPKAWCDNSPFLSALENRRLHAVLLANSKISTTPKDVVMFRVEPPEGQPLAYGWHSNGDGSEVQAVMDAGNYTRHYRLIIEGGFDGRPKAVKMSLLNEGPWAVANAYHCLAFPDLPSQREMYVKGGAGTPCNAPIHVVFRNGAFVTYNIRFADGIVGLGPQTGAFSSPYNSESCEVTKGAETVDYGAGGDYPFGYNWGNEEVYILAWFWPGWESVDLPALTDTDAGSWGTTLSSVSYHHWNMDTESMTGASDYTKPLLIVPFGDCESVAEGKVAGTTYGSKSVNRGYGGGYPKRMAFSKRWVARNEDGSYTIGPWEPWGAKVFKDPDTVGSWTGVEASIHTSNSRLALADYYATHVNTSNGNDVAAKEMAVKLGCGVSVPVTDPSNAYFAPELGPTGDPSDNPSYTFGTTGASYRFELGHGPSGSGDWPAGNPVGWA